MWLGGSLKSNNDPSGCQYLATVVVKIIGRPSVKSVWFGGSLKANNGQSGCHDVIKMATVTETALQ